MSAVEALRMARENGTCFGIAGANLILDADVAPPVEVVDAIRCHKDEIVALLVADHDTWTAEDWRAFFDERAGIAEFDGGQSRSEAEALAFDCCVAQLLNRHPCRSDPGRCAACGKPDRQGHAVVPFGTGTNGDTWLHPECCQDWYKARKAEAIAALIAMGIEIGVPRP